MSATDRSALGPLRFLLVASVVGPLVLFLAVGWYNYGATFDGAEHEMARASEVAREHAAKVFDSDKLLAEYVADLVRGRGAAAIADDEAALHAKLRHLIAEVPQIQSVLLVDRDGNSLVGSDEYPIAHAFSVADREFFAAMRDTPYDTYLSETFVGQRNQQPAFAVVRRRTSADDSFDGLVVVAVSPRYFMTFDQSLVGRDGSVVTLVRDDGQLILRYPDFPLPAMKVAPGSRFMTTVAAQPDGGSYVDNSVLDGAQRLYVFRRVSRYPAYVVVGRPVAGIVADWQRRMAGFLLFGVPATLALFLTTLIALRRTRDQRRAVLQAEQETRRREAAEDALRQSQKLEAIGQLTGGVAHDFNNLLTAVLGNLELVDMRIDDERLRRMIQTASRAAQRGAALTQQLLAFSRKQHLVPAPTDLNATVTTLCELLQRTLGGTIAIECDLQPSLWDALVDPTQIELAILNLAINARDAMPGGGSLVIATRNLPAADCTGRSDLDAGDYVVVAVADTGTGMSDEVLARAFEPFYTTKEVGKGSGLGLSQVYGLAHQSGGSVNIRSRQGHGTTVDLVLPRAIDALPAVEPELVADVFERRLGLVLVVDDEEDVRQVALLQLSALGYATIDAGNGEAALRLLNSGAEPDLVLVDYAMPGMNGIELVHALRQRKPGLPAIVITGYADAQPFLGGIERLGFLKKPYRIHELAAKVGAALNPTPEAKANA